METNVNLEEAVAAREEELNTIGVDSLDLPFRVTNMTWEEFCAIPVSLRYLTLELTPPISAPQVILGEPFGDEQILHLSTNGHKIPHIEGVDPNNIVLRVLSKGLLIKEMIVHEDSTYGMQAFVPFGTDLRKIIGYFVNSRFDHYYDIKITRADEGVANSVLPPSELRDVSLELTEDDKVAIMNFNPKFKKQLEGWKTVSDVLTEIANVMIISTDPAYIGNLMKLSIQISYGVYTL